MFGSTRKRKELTLREKVQLIHSSEGKSHRTLANEFNVSKTQVTCILKRKAELMEVYETEGNPDRKRQFQNSAFTEIDNIVFEWFSSIRSLDIHVSGPMIQAKALEVAKALNQPDFKASGGWLFRFKNRHSIGGKKISGEKSTVSQETIDHCTMSEGTPTKCCIAVVQMRSVPDKEATFCQASKMVQEAKKQGAEMVFLPEACDYIGDSRSYTTMAAETLDGDIVTRYCHLAARLKVWLSLGSVHVKSNDVADSRISNTHIIVDSEGQIKSTYSKTHLFDVDIPGKVRLKETEFTRPGTTIGPPVETPAGRVGMAICYDLRFPELSTVLAQQGADILTYPSAFTIPTGEAHWEILLRARAIENQCFVVAAAQVGQHHPKRASYGHAMVIDPWGKALLDLQEEEGVGTVELDLTSLSSRRLEMPVWNHRRHDLYGYLQSNTNTPIDSMSRYQFGQVTISSGCVFYKTALSYAFVNKKPVVPGHVLISPIRVAERLDDLTAAEVADLAHATMVVSKVIEGHHGCTSRTLGIQDGAEAGQSIKHVHFHVLPRKKGDFKRNDDIYTELETHDKDVNESEWRTEEDMIEEASQLRKLFS